MTVHNAGISVLLSVTTWYHTRSFQFEAVTQPQTENRVIVEIITQHSLVFYDMGLLLYNKWISPNDVINKIHIT